MEHVLEELGLTPLEVKIYVNLLSAGPSSAGEVSRHTGIHRRNVYDALERLIERGLVSYIKENNQRVYTVNDPSVVLEKIRTKERDWEALMPKLKSQISAWGDRRETLFFRGKNGVRHVFLDQVNQDAEILVFATSIDVSHVVKHFMEKYQLLRVERGVKTRMIFDASMQDALKMGYISKKGLCSVRYVPNFNDTPVSHYIYGDTVTIITWEPEPFAILIRQSAVAQAYRQQFEVLWAN